VPGTVLPRELVSIRFADQDPLSAWGILQDLEAGDVFGWSGIPPGTYEVLVRRGRKAEPVFVVGDLHVVAGEVLEDERLASLDLESLLPTITLTLFGPDGQRLGRNLQGTLGIRHKKVIEEVRSPDEDTVTVTPERLPVDLVVSVWGYSRAELRDVATGLDVHLEPAPTLLLRLPIAPPEGWSLVLSVTKSDEAPWKVRGNFGGTMRIARPCKQESPTEHLAESPGPGSYKLFVSAFRMGGSRAWDGSIEVRQEIVVPEGQLHGELSLEVTQAQLDALCKPR
jgi:hypothetical protein